MTLYEFIVFEAAKLDLDIQTLAEKIKVNKNTLYQSKHRKLSLNVMARLANAFDVPLRTIKELPITLED